MNDSEDIATPIPSSVKTAPKSWADLVRTKPMSAAAGAKALDETPQQVNGFQQPKPGSLLEVLRSYDTESGSSRVAFLEPRGLVNTGNMCYMNSVSLLRFNMSGELCF